MHEATDSCPSSELQASMAYYLAQRRQNHNARIRIYLENMDMDSVLVVIKEDENSSDLEQMVPIYIEKRQYVEADSLIDLIIQEEGGVASAHTELLQLQLSLQSLMNGAQGADSNAVDLLELMVLNDPYGAMSAKALLTLINRVPYKRVPWVLNDTLPGKNIAQQAVALVEFKVWPNPNTEGEVFIQWEEVTGSGSFKLYDLIGREIAVGDVDLQYGYGSVQLRNAGSGTCLLRIQVNDLEQFKTIVIR